MSRNIGSVKSVKLNLKDKEDNGIMMMPEPMTLKEIAIFVGQNGSGKTLVLKFIWVVSMMLYNSVNYRRLRPHMTELNEELKNENYQFLIDKSFDENNFNGTIEATFEHASVSLKLTNGKIAQLEIEVEQGYDLPTLPIFMSKNLRTFDDIKKYLQFRKLNNIVDVKSNPESFEKMLEIYRIYDVTFVESLLLKLKEPKDIPDNVLESLHSFEGMEKYNMKKLGADLESCDIYFLNENNERVNLTRLSAGEQSLTNMVISQLI